MTPFTLDRDDLAFPPGLRDLSGLPWLRVRGALPPCRAIAIVGSRECSEEAERFAFDLAGKLVRAGLAVWSGGALGIDSAAHRGALAAGGATVVVLGGGIRRPFPPENEGLFDEVVDRGGAVVSRREDHAPANPGWFHARNAVIAAATEATIVIECGAKSGALSTAREARKLNRPLGCVPHAPWSAWGGGCLFALGKGARVVTCIADALRLLPLPPDVPEDRDVTSAIGPLFAMKAAVSVLTGLEQRVHAALDGVRHVDELCDLLGEPAKALVPVLVTLSLQGLVREETPGMYRRA